LDIARSPFTCFSLVPLRFLSSSYKGTFFFCSPPNDGSKYPTPGSVFSFWQLLPPLFSMPCLPADTLPCFPHSTSTFFFSLFSLLFFLLSFPFSLPPTQEGTDVFSSALFFFPHKSVLPEPPGQRNFSPTYPSLVGSFSAAPCFFGPFFIDFKHRIRFSPESRMIPGPFLLLSPVTFSTRNPLLSPFFSVSFPPRGIPGQNVTFGRLPWLTTRFAFSPFVHLHPDNSVAFPFFFW